GSRLNSHRQRPRLHRPLRRRTQRVRTPPARAGREAEERQTEPPPDPREDRTLPPDPETLARPATRGRDDPRPASAARPTPHRIQRPPPAPRPRPQDPFRGLPRHPESTPCPTTPPRPLPTPLRPRRRRRARQHPPRRPHAPPRHRTPPHRQTRPRDHRRDHRHSHPPRHRRDPQRAQPRPHPRLLAQPTPTTRTMAPEMTDVSRHTRPMSRDITWCPWRDSNPQPFP